MDTSTSATKNDSKLDEATQRRAVSPRTKTAGSDGGDGGDPPRRKDSNAKKLLRFSSTTILILALLVFELTLLVLIVMLILGLIPLQIGAEETPLFRLLPLVLVFGWLGLLTGYLAWCTHFYNYNFGRSDAFWKKFVARCREAEAEGRTENDVYDELAAPRGNPYAAETFGIPSGSVRGSIAMTILVAALGLLISLFGGAPPSANYFEFFETAFLMVVAFYFGTKGLSILQGERKFVPNAAPEPTARRGSEPVGLSGAGAPSIGVDPAVQMPREETAEQPIVPVSGLVGKRQKLLDLNFPHIKDLLTVAREQPQKVRELEPADFEAFALEHDLEIPVVRAVVDVESGGRGFWNDGRPKILFEGHVFWRQLKERGVDPNKYASDNPTILYPKWQRKHYKGGPAEYERLAAAKLIDEEAALCSASWGLFQIMGYHAPSLEYEDVIHFVDEMKKTEREHLDAFGRYLIRDDLVKFLREKQWASFARRYNGPGYAENRYDEKLQKSYAKHKAQRDGMLVA